MDEKKLIKSLSDLTAQLKSIADSLGVSTGVGKKGGAKKKQGLSKEELSKEKEIAKLHADEYQKTLGLNFKDNDKLDKIVKRFKVGMEVSRTISLITSVRDHLKDFKDKWIKQLSNAATLSKKSSGDLLKSLGWDEFVDVIYWNIRREEEHRDFVVDSWEKLSLSLDRLLDNATKPKKKESGGDFKDKLKNVAGLALIGMGIFLIVQALVNSGDIDLGKTLKVLGVVSAFMLLFLFVSDKAARIKASAIGFAILSATILFLVMPMMEQLAEMPLGKYLNGLIKMGLIMVTCIGLLKLMEKIKAADVTKSVLGLGLLSLVIGMVVIPLLETLNEVNYPEMIASLIKMGTIVGAMFGLMKLMEKIDGSSAIKASIGIGILTVVIGMVVVPFLDTIAQVDLKLALIALGKMGVIVGAMWILLKLMENIKGSEVIKSTLGMTMLVVLLGTIILPALEVIAKEDFNSILAALGNTALTVLGLGLILKVIGKLFENGVKEALVGVIAVVALSFTLGYLAENLKKLTDFDWGEIYKNLGLATLAIALFGAAVVGIGFLVANPIVAPLIAVGAAVVLGLSFLMATLAESLQKFQGIDGENLKSVGLGMAALGVGLTAFLVGMVSGVAGSAVSKIGSFFGLDPASQIKKFESIDADKIYTLGIGLKEMGEGLKILTSGINLKGMTEGLIAMISPLITFTAALEVFRKSFAELDKVVAGSEIEQIYKLKIETENNIQNSILELNRQELAVQQAQLEAINTNNDLLYQISQNMRNMGSNEGGMRMMPQSKGGNSITASNFNTKDKYLNHMKLASMSINY